jgi:hypothetical protein
MAARRLILVMLVLLVLSSAVAALIPVDRAERDETTTQTSTTTQPVPAGELVEARISGDSAKPKRILVHKGDQLSLTVSASSPAAVEIEALGVFDDVDRFLPAVIDLLPVDRGTYPVRLLPDTEPGTGRVIGRIVVRGARDSAG